jgi:hypothetical protein
LIIDLLIGNNFIYPEVPKEEKAKYRKKANGKYYCDDDNDCIS